jgi:hypothetical protein
MKLLTADASQSYHGQIKEKGVSEGEGGLKEEKGGRKGSRSEDKINEEEGEGYEI